MCNIQSNLTEKWKLARSTVVSCLSTDQNPSFHKSLKLIENNDQKLSNKFSFTVYCNKQWSSKNWTLEFRNLID